jgi:hypothetical protein
MNIQDKPGTNDESGDSTVHVHSGYGAQSRKPFVGLSFGHASVQMAPNEAREIARHLLEAAEAAEGDGFLVEFVSETGGMELDEAANILFKFRDYREAQRQRNRPDSGSGEQM